MSNKNIDRRKFGKYLAGSTAALMTGGNIASAKDPVADGITRPSNALLLDGGGQSVWNSTAQHVRTNGWISSLAGFPTLWQRCSKQSAVVGVGESVCLFWVPLKTELYMLQCFISTLDLYILLF